MKVKIASKKQTKELKDVPVHVMASISNVVNDEEDDIEEKNRLDDEENGQNETVPDLKNVNDNEDISTRNSNSYVENTEKNEAYNVEAINKDRKVRVSDSDNRDEAINFSIIQDVRLN